MKNKRQLFSYRCFLLLLITSFFITQAQELSISPSPIDFGNVLTGTSSNLNFTLTNNSSTNAYSIDNVNGFVITGADANQFLANNNPPPFPIQPNEFIDYFSVTFQPMSDGVKNAVLEIYTDAPDSPTVVNITGTAYSTPIPDINVNDIDFGTIQVTQSTTGTLTILNAGQADLVISNMLVSGGVNSSFSLEEGISYPITISAGNTVNYTITFNPIAKYGSLYNVFTDSLQILSNDPVTPTNVSLSGMVFPPNIPDPAAAFNFGDLPVGTTLTQDYTVTNSGTGTLIIENIRKEPYGVGADASLDYTINNLPVFPFNLNSGESLTLNVSFTPNSTGDRNVNLYFDTKNYDSPTYLIQALGSGTDADFSALNTLNLPGTRLNTSTTSSFQITNNGTTDLILSSGILSGIDAGNFNISSVNNVQTILPGQTTSVSIDFTPTTLGVKNASINFTSNSVASPHIIQLTGEGINSNLTVSPANIPLPDTPVQSYSNNQLVTLSNVSGTDSVIISDINIFGTDAGNFNLVGVNLPITINAGAQDTFQVNFAPQTSGNKTAQINIISNDDNSPQTIVLSGNAQAPNLNLSSILLEFLDTEAGIQSRTKPFNIVNTGTSDLTITNISFSGVNASEFQLQGENFPITVLPLNSKSIEVVFSPQSAGIKGAILTVTSNLAGSVDLPLLGKGKSPDLTFSGSADFGDINFNSTKENNINLINSGSSNLIITDINITGADSGAFSINNLTFPIEIPSGEQHQITVSGIGNSSGIKNAGLVVISNDLNSPKTLDLTSNVTMLPFFSSQTTPFQLNSVLSGESISYTHYPITNIGVSDLIIGTSDAIIINSDGGGIVIEHSVNIPVSVPDRLLNNFPVTIAPGETKDILISFYEVAATSEISYAKIGLPTNQTVNGYYNSNVSVQSWINEMQFTVGVQRPGFQLSTTNPIVFPDTSIGRSSFQTFEVTNTGNIDLNIFTSETDNLGMFRIRGETGSNIGDNHFSLLVSPGETHTFTVEFLPVGVVGQKSENLTLRANVPHPPFYSTTDYLIPVTGFAGEPVDVDVDGMIFQADSKTVNGNIVLLSGNVHAGNLEFSQDVTINLLTKEVSCTNCEMYATNIPIIGEFGGNKVVLKSGDINTVVTTASGFPELDFTSFGTVSNGFFKMVGIPLEITKIKILPDSPDDPDSLSDGIEVGGIITLPPEMFGEDANITMETIQISTITGINVVGSVIINPELNVLGIFQLNSASANFDTFTNSFGGAAEIGFDLMGKGVTVAAEFQIIRGNLDSVNLEIEVDPGIPIATTGFKLAGGNGFVEGLVEPPISIGLGVDIAPASPLDEVLYFDNMQLAYTFGTSFEASGTIQLFKEDVGGGSISIFANPNQQGVSAGVWADVFDIFKGEVDFTVENLIDSQGTSSLNLEMNAKLTLTIPEIEDEFCSFACQAVNGFLPLAIAEIDVSMNNTSMSAEVTVAEVASLKATVETNDAGTGSKFTLGGNIGPLNFSFARAAQQRGINNLVFENDSVAMAKDPIEGQSLLVDANSTYRNGNAVIDVPFLLLQSYKNIYVRVAGTNTIPDYSLILPDGTELTNVNASDFNALFTTYSNNNSAFFILKDTQVGNYIIRLNDSDTYQLDVAGAEFAPSISNVSVSQNTSNNDILINWNDQDIDSDAVVSFYYDTDNKGGNGLLIQDNISEDDNTDQITWNANYLKNGTYYVYGKIDDGSNTPKILYANETFTINNENSILAPTLVADTFIDTIVLSWSEISEASHYLVYIDENPITFLSPSQNVGQKTSFDFTDILPGRTYHFAVKTVFDDGTTLTESNFSNIETISFISTTSNNIPKIETEELPAKYTACNEYVTTINISDPDVNDTLTLSLLKAPVGMTLTNNTLHWYPNKYQLGKHEVIAEVNDGNGGIDTKSFTVTVFEVDTENPIPNVANLQNVTAECNTTLIPPTAMDNCSGEIIATTDITTFTTQGTFNVIWTYEDSHGNILEQTQQVTIQDITPPVVQTNDITIALDTNGTASITANQIDNNSTDNCAIDTRILDIQTFNCSNLGQNTVTLSVTDVNGLTSTNTAIVTVVDTEMPIAVSQDITIQLDTNGIAVITPDQIDNNSIDNCEISAKYLDVTTFTCDDIGVNNVTLTVLDAGGNESTSTAIVTIEDNIIPIVNTQDITISLDALGNAFITTNDVDNNSTDNCGIISRSLDISTFSCNDIGDNTVTLVAIDSNGNFASQQATVTVVDDLAPQLTCLENITVEADTNNQFEIPNYLTSIIKTDNCTDSDNIVITQDITTGTIVGLGDTVITFTATDAYNNQSTCSFTLTVNSVLDTNNYNLNSKIILYPNPANNKITIIGKDVIIKKIVVYDLLGKVILSSNNTTTNIDISHLTSGTYFVQITDVNQNSTVKKFIKK